MKKIEPIEALARIKIKIKRFYDSLGINEFLGGNIGEMDLINEIDNILDRVKIPVKNLIAEDLDEEFKPTRSEILGETL